MRLKTLLASLYLFLLTSCSNMQQVSDFNGYVTLPYSEDGFGIGVISHKETTIPAAQWRDKRNKGIVLLSEDWKKLRIDILKNCQFSQCKQFIGSFDQLFLTIDKGLQLAPLP